ncbi:MAG: hypothetical protein AABY40_01255, partial [Nanoarchaeota archaeon]
ERDKKYGWDYCDKLRIDRADGEMIMPSKVSISARRPLILDIDLDAFSCHQKGTLSFLPKYKGDYESVLGFEGRIDSTMKVLAQLPKPNLITIASSQGDKKYDCYVPPEIVDDVGRYLAVNLRKLYQLNP